MNMTNFIIKKKRSEKLPVRDEDSWAAKQTRFLHVLRCLSSSESAGNMGLGLRQKDDEGKLESEIEPPVVAMYGILLLHIFFLYSF